jgi:hypothetical protein
VALPFRAETFVGVADFWLHRNAVWVEVSTCCLGAGGLDREGQDLDMFPPSTPAGGCIYYMSSAFIGRRYYAGVQAADEQTCPHGQRRGADLAEYLPDLELRAAIVRGVILQVGVHGRRIGLVPRVSPLKTVGSRPALLEVRGVMAGTPHHNQVVRRSSDSSWGVR